MMKIVFMGTPDFAVGSLQALVEAKKYDIVAVVTQPDRPKGRGNKVLYTPVKEYALSVGLPVYQPAKVKTPEFMAQMAEWAPDMVVVAAFGQLLNQQLLDTPKYACINVHASLLPKYRGAAPIHYAIWKGEVETGVTIMQMELGMDTGGMYSKVVVPIGPEATMGELHDELKEKGAQLLLASIDKIAEGSLKAEPQIEAEATKATLLTKAMEVLDWSLPAAELHNHIRAFNPAPGTYTVLPNGKKVKVWASSLTETKATAAPGTVVEVTKKDFSVACGDFLLRILEVQPESKKRMPAQVFLNGHGVAVGEVLGVVK